MNSELIPIVERFSGTRVLLVGDFMLDQYLFGDAERISPEAPVPVLRIIDRQDRVGGAGSVALNLATLGANATCCGMLGHDASGELVIKLLSEAGVNTTGLIRVEDRPTITKTRMVGLAEHRHRQQILRVDDEIVRPPSETDATRLLVAAKAAINDANVICLEDYAKGVLMPRFCQQIITAARRAGKPVLVDPGRLSNWSRYAGATAMTPNRAELEMGVGRALTDAEVPAAAHKLVEQLELDALVVTLGRDGALLVRADGSQKRFPTRPRAVYDNTGAGDAVLAMMAVALAAGATLEQAVPLANVAGGLEVSKFGCVPIAREEVLEDLQQSQHAGRSKVRTPAELVPELEARQARGETVVFTNGCFDILHPGHVELLEQSKAQGSLLVVGINTDASVRLQGKGDDRPIRSQTDRARMLAALECVDYVTTFEEPDPGKLIETLSPDILIKGSDWADKGVIGREFVESRGGKVVLVDLVEGYSTTGELERIRGLAPKPTGAPHA
jgi:D-beta-D-heptose 7-phosphate kinase/D-beta-D-heptose 1-phosphate adenosyltransferase